MSFVVFCMAEAPVTDGNEDVGEVMINDEPAFLMQMRYLFYGPFATEQAAQIHADIVGGSVYPLTAPVWSAA